VRPHLDVRLPGVAGFTLVEMLIAITIVMLMVPLAVQGVQTGLAAWERLGQHAEQADWLRSARRVVRQQVGEALPLLEDVQGRGRVVEFQGRAHTLSFVGRMPRGVRPGGLYRQFLLLAAVDDGKVLVMRLRPFEPANGSTLSVASRELVLMRDVAAFDLAYFGSADGKGRPRWHNEWIDRPVLPQRVRLTITRSNAGGAPVRMVMPVYAQVGRRS